MLQEQTFVDSNGFSLVHPLRLAKIDYLDIGDKTIPMLFEDFSRTTL